MSIFTTRGVLTPKLWSLLNPACQDASFGTLQSLIGHMVPEILTAGKIPEQQQEEEEEYIRILRFQCKGKEKSMNNRLETHPSCKMDFSVKMLCCNTFQAIYSQLNFSFIIDPLKGFWGIVGVHPKIYETDSGWLRDIQSCLVTGSFYPPPDTPPPSSSYFCYCCFFVFLFFSKFQNSKSDNFWPFGSCFS